MSETDSTVETNPEAAGHEGEVEIKNEDGSVNWQQAARKWEREAKKHLAKVSELEPKATQFDALSAASQTELERAQAQAQALQQELANTQRTALISSVALDKGLPANLARRLQGDSREELEADADELLSTFGTTNTSRTPAPDPSQGSSAHGGGAATPAQQFASLIQKMPG